ncbi:MAG: PAS domain S-box protein [Arcobacteraceae bacterium]|jgi:PAS domain S-box-containing protein|nr:PAS domain S-box protein [Arcobacteraceae bacterium]
MIKTIRDLKSQIIIVLILFSIAILSLFIVTNEYLFGDKVQQRTLQNGINKLKERELLFQSFLVQSSNTLKAITQSVAFSNYVMWQDNDINDLLITIFNENSNFKQISFIDKNGIERLLIERENEKQTFYRDILLNKFKDKSKEEYFEISKHKQIEKVWFSSLEVELINGKVENSSQTTLKAILPIQIDGKFGGILVINYFMDGFIYKLFDTPLYNMVLANNNGVILKHYDDAKSWKEYTLNSEFQNDGENIKNHDIYLSDSCVSRKLNLPIEGGLIMVLQSSQKYIASEKKEAFSQYSIVALLVFLFTILASLYLSRKIKNLYAKYFKIEETNIQLRNLNEELRNHNAITLMKDEQILRTSLKLQLAIKTSRIGIWEWNFGTNTLVWDNQMYSIYGIDKITEENPYEMWSRAIDPSDKKRVEENLNYAVETNGEYNAKFWIKTGNSERKYIHALGLCELDSYGNKIRMVGINQDITEDKEEFESIFKYSVDGIAIVDLESNFLSFNDAYVEMIGYTHNELKEKSCFGLTDEVDKEKTKETLQYVTKEGFVKNFEKTCITKDGRKITVNMSMVLLPDKKRILAMVKDITNGKLLESQSKLASMGEMIGNIAHQWRQPLSVISTLATAITFKQAMDTLTQEDISRNTEMIVKQTKYLSDTIEDFRNFIKTTGEKRVFRLSDMIQKTLSLTNPTLVMNGIEAIVDVDENLTMLGFDNELIQALMNIINNTKDAFCDESFIENEKYLFISVNKKYEKIEILLRDTAGGIADEIVAKIFEPYFTTKHQSLGTGLGLSMTYKIITQRHNGVIKATTDEFEYNGKKYRGATFLITFPSILVE